MVFFLLGMPGTGKSSIGKNVAKMLDFNFIDLDKMIEKKSDSSIAEIWQKFGEDYFRNLESKTLKEISVLQNTLVSCGGGTPCYFENIKWMNASGTTIYLELPTAILRKRLFEKRENRPMFSQLKTVEELELKLNEVYNARKSFYETAHHSIILKGTYPNDFFIVKEKITQLM
jgi:shikimate kinase